MAKMQKMDFYQAFHFLKNHRIFGDRFLESLDITVVKVDPKTKRVADKRERNTLTRVWLEAGPLIKRKPGKVWEGPDFYTDPDLNCGGDTFEDAIICLAEKVLSIYGWDTI